MKNKLVKNIKHSFIKRFNKQPLLVASPGRINLIGEHTDYNNGFVFPASIDKYIVSALSKNKEKVSFIYSYNMDESIELDLKNIKKEEKKTWKNYALGVIKEIQLKGFELQNFNLVFGGNVPEGAGLSSSAALENSIVFGLNELFQLKLSKDEMIQISVKAEQNFAGVQCGIMDQFSSMKGKVGNALFLDCKNLSYKNIPIKMNEHELVLINSNVKHSLFDSSYNKRKEECNIGLSILQNNFANIKSLRDVNLLQLKYMKNEIPPIIYNRCLYIIEENERVHKAKNAIENNNWSKFGQLLFASHQGLQQLYEVSCEEIDFLVAYAKNSNNVVGSRMIGGGFGGCTLNLIKKGEVENFTKSLAKKYKEKYNTQIDIYAVNISNGTHLITS
jgi:galactokinase